MYVYIDIDIDLTLTVQTCQLEQELLADSCVVVLTVTLLELL